MLLSSSVRKKRLNCACVLLSSMYAPPVSGVRPGCNYPNCIPVLPVMQRRNILVGEQERLQTEKRIAASDLEGQVDALRAAMAQDKAQLTEELMEAKASLNRCA
jgi:hypothetical protein